MKFELLCIIDSLIHINVSFTFAAYIIQDVSKKRLRGIRAARRACRDSPLLFLADRDVGYDYAADLSAA